MAFERQGSCGGEPERALYRLVSKRRLSGVPEAQKSGEAYQTPKD
ncbi:MAG TPA: hypothetical protein VJ715_09610 [Pyrinomonadaceae bacterium]|nr:hypothetical protein [Pyrinomonadaceae bacterium]